MDRLLASLTYRQLQGWQAYHQIDPFGQERGDLRAALIKHALLNVMGRGEDDPEIPLEDCLPRFGESQWEKARRAKQQERDIRETLRRL